jgi:ammonium transporter, Amt family
MRIHYDISLRIIGSNRRILKKRNVLASTNINHVWVLVCAVMVFAMQAGFMCLEAGLTRTKNNINVSIKNLCDFGIAVALFWALGFGLMFGVSQYGLFGGSRFFEDLGVGDVSVFFVFQAMFCGTAVSIISGAVAERLKFSSYLVIAAVMGGLIYPVVGHWAWSGLETGKLNGWLGAIGFVDFAGGTIVHSTGGWVALAIVLLIGAREGRFPENAAPRRFNGSNIPLSVLGVMILWFGWFGFNGGSVGKFNETVPLVIMNTMIGGTFGMVASIALGLFWNKRVDVFLVMNGTLGGLLRPVVMPSLPQMPVSSAQLAASL